jgi:mycoredoxin
MSMASSPVTVYWRPGCGYCARLRTRLRREGIPTDEVNIWEEPDGAAFVRSVARGNETVPTVTVGDQALVNPPPRRLVEVIREFDPSLVGAAQSPGRVLEWLVASQWIVIAGLIALSFTLEAVGRSGISWVVDGVAVATYFGFRFLRNRALRQPGRPSPAPR